MQYMEKLIPSKVATKEQATRAARGHCRHGLNPTVFQFLDCNIPDTVSATCLKRLGMQRPGDCNFRHMFGELGKKGSGPWRLCHQVAED